MGLGAEPPQEVGLVTALADLRALAVLKVALASTCPVNDPEREAVAAAPAALAALLEVAQVAQALVDETSLYTDKVIELREALDALAGLGCAADQEKSCI